MNGNDHASDPSQGRQEYQQFKPNEVVSPQGAAPSSAQPQPASSAQPQPPVLPAPSAQPEPDEQHFFNPSNASAPEVYEVPDSNGYQPLDVRMEDSSQGVSWTASEFVAHNKSAEWYMAVGIVAVLLAVIVYFMSHDIISVVITLIVAIIFGIGASRQPRQMQYAVSDNGVSIGAHFYPYGSFRSFTVASEGPFRSIVFMPLKRFMPPISIYFDPADEQRIGEILADHLPMHEHREAATDKLMRRIRF